MACRQRLSLAELGIKHINSGIFQELGIIEILKLYGQTVCGSCGVIVTSVAVGSVGIGSGVAGYVGKGAGLSKELKAKPGEKFFHCIVSLKL